MDGSREVSNAAKPRSASKSSEKRGCMRGRRASERSVAFVSGRGMAPTKLVLKSKTKIHRANMANKYQNPASMPRLIKLSACVRNENGGLRMHEPLALRALFVFMRGCCDGFGRGGG